MHSKRTQRVSLKGATVNTELEKRIRKAIESIPPAFNKADDAFRLCEGKKVYPERTVSYYFVAALKKALRPASVLLEIPVPGKRGSGWSNHVDALVFNDREAVVAEFKTAWAPSDWKELGKDLERLQKKAMCEIQERFRDGHKRTYFIFLGADCWRRDIAKAWKGGEPNGKWRKWQIPEALRNAHRDYVTIYLDDPPDRPKDYDGYYFTWGLIRA